MVDPLIMPTGIESSHATLRSPLIFDGLSQSGRRLSASRDRAKAADFHYGEVLTIQLNLTPRRFI